ncbi:MAG: 50S ribosomal protein L6 [Verrucomicrobia bacterium]|nr:50S ribosomal protein L6 [Verrucomicrobiota bacterium]
MSRVGKSPVLVPANVKVALEGNHLKVEGPLGKLGLNLPPKITAKVDAGRIILIRDSEERMARSMHGLARSLVNNLVLGVSTGYSKKLEIHGVGFKANLQGKKLVLNLGKSHPIEYAVPPEIKITITDGTRLTIEGADKQLVGAVSADIRSYHPPEPYKGKGVRYVDEIIRRKEGKTAQSKTA